MREGIKLKYIISLLLILSTNLFAYFDKDMDGVDNLLDRCPGTPITDLVDFNGCSIESLASYHHYDIILGTSYAQTDYRVSDKIETLTTSLQIDYFYKDFTLQIYSSYYNSSNKYFSDSGVNDTVVAGYYRFKLYDNLLLNIGAGIILPSYDAILNNNNTDYIGSINLNYAINSNVNIFAGYNYTIVNDDNIKDIEYHNTSAYNIGAGYYLTQKAYISGSYNNSQSIYSSIPTIGSIPNIENATIYIFYSIDQNWFTNASYSYGLSKSANEHYTSIRIGYYF